MGATSGQRASAEEQSPAMSRAMADKLLRPTPAARSAALVVLGVAALLLVCLYMLAPGRSFHQDELVTLAAERKRAQGDDFEPQHKTYHDFSLWWIGDKLQERHARIPSMLFVTLGVISLAVLAGRLAGARAAAITALVCVLWPRVWDDGLELRYYALIFLCATVALHALLLVLRGRFLVPMVVLAALLLLLRRWHPSALPFHTGILGIAFCHSVYTTWSGFRSLPRDRSLGSRRAFVLLCLRSAAIVAALAAGAVATMHLDSGAIWSTARGRLATFSPSNLHLSDLLRWLFGWVDDQFAPAFHPLRVVRISFAFLLVVGGARLFRLSRTFLCLCVSLLLLQVVASGIFANSWLRMAVGYKYLTSSAPLLILCVSIGIDSILSWAEARGGRPAVRMAMAAVGLLYALPLLPRVWISATGDASHFREIWGRILRDGGTPLVYAHTDTTLSYRPYKLILPTLNASVLSSEMTDQAGVEALLARAQPTWIALSPTRLEQLPIQALLRREIVYTSNYTPTWDVVLARRASDQVLQTGRSLMLQGDGLLIILERGIWRLEGASPAGISIDGKPILPWEELQLEGPRLVPYSVGARPVRLVPVVGDGSRRSGAFAAKGPLDRTNRPSMRDGNRVYTLQADVPVEHHLYTPPEARYLRITISEDPPTVTNLLVIINNRHPFAGVPSPIPGSNDHLFQVPLPSEAWGGDLIVSISREREGGGPIHLVALEFAQDLLAVGSPQSDLVGTAPFSAPPDWVVDGSVDMTSPDRATVLSHRGPSAVQPVIEAIPGGVAVYTPRGVRSTLVAAPPFAVRPGDLMLPRIELRALNVIVNSMVPVVYFSDSRGESVGSRALGSGAVGSNDVAWTERRALVTVPEGAATAILGLYINAPDTTRRRDDGVFEIRSMEFLRPDR